MEKNNTISVIIPNYNNELYLDMCLESVLAQSHKDLEIIIIDDCSTDNSQQIIKKIGENNQNIKAVYNPENIGVADCRHMGIMLSTGVFVSTLDSDDIYLRSDKLEKEFATMLTCMRAGRSNAIVFSGIVLLDAQGEVMSRPQGNVSQGFLLNEIVRRTCMIPRDFLFTKEQYVNAGGFDSTIPIYEDWDLKIRLAKNNQFYYSGIEGIGYRRHGTGLSSVSPLRHAYWLMRIFAKNYSLLETGRGKSLRMLSGVILKMVRNYVKNKYIR